MKYFDLVPVGQLVTRSVSDIESIARILVKDYSRIISDLMKMVVVLAHVLYELVSILDCHCGHAYFGSNYSNFSTKNASSFEEVRTQMPIYFVQERVTGMKIVQPFTREVIEADKF
jgi:hypothetical protein